MGRETKRPLAIEHSSPYQDRKDPGAPEERDSHHPDPVAPSSSVKSRETGTIWSKETSSAVMAILRCVYRKRLRAGSGGEDRVHGPPLSPIVEALAKSPIPSLVPRIMQAVPVRKSSCTDRSSKLNLAHFGGTSASWVKHMGDLPVACDSNTITSATPFLL